MPFCFVCSKHLSCILTLAIMGIFTICRWPGKWQRTYIYNSATNYKGLRCPISQWPNTGCRNDILDNYSDVFPGMLLGVIRYLTLIFDSDFFKVQGAWLNQFWYIQTVQHYSSKKRDKLLTYMATYMNCKNIYAKWKKPYTKAYIQYDSFFKKLINFLKTFLLEYSWFTMLF